MEEKGSQDVEIIKPINKVEAAAGGGSLSSTSRLPYRSCTLAGRRETRATGEGSRASVLPWWLGQTLGSAASALTLGNFQSMPREQECCFPAICYNPPAQPSSCDTFPATRPGPQPLGWVHWPWQWLVMGISSSAASSTLGLHAPESLRTWPRHSLNPTLCWWLAGS